MKETEWKRWANETELSMLLSWRAAELHIIRERKKIRDRCYMRARRQREKENG